MAAPDPMLDAAQEAVLHRFWELRNLAGPERGVDVQGEDPLVARHLRAIDREFFRIRSEAAKAMQDQRKATRH